MLDNYSSDDAEWLDRRPWDIRDHTDTMLITIKDNLTEGFHDRMFGSMHRIAKDSGGFVFLQNPELAADFDVDGLIEQHKRVGVQDTDIIISADFPVPRCTGITDQDMRERQNLTRTWFEQMSASIPQTIPVLHGATATDIMSHYESYDLNGQMVAIGSNLAQTTPRVMDTIGQDKTLENISLVDRGELWDILIDATAMLRDEDRDIFILGAGGMNASKIAAMLGSKCVDATSWRLNALCRQIMDTEHGRFIKTGDAWSRYEDKEWVSTHLHDVWADATYPFGKDAGYTYAEMIETLRAPGATGAGARCIHNVWEQDADAKRLAEFEDDPDGLYLHLQQCWNSSDWRDTRNLKLLDKAYASVKDASVEPTFHNYARS
jgi:hypothetical protein